MLYTYITYICNFINNLLRSSGRCSASLADDDDDDASKSTGRTIIRLDGNLFSMYFPCLSAELYHFYNLLTDYRPFLLKYDYLFGYERD